jgi:hypothetical protein
MYSLYTVLGFDESHADLNKIGSAPGLPYDEPGTAGWYREQLVALYEKHNPPKVADVDR